MNKHLATIITIILIGTIYEVGVNGGAEWLYVAGGSLAVVVAIIASMATKTGEHTHDDDQSGGGGGQVPARQHRSRRGDAGARESSAITPLGVRRVL